MQYKGKVKDLEITISDVDVVKVDKINTIPDNLTGYTVTLPANWKATADYGDFIIKGYLSGGGYYIGLWIGANKGGSALDNSITFVSTNYEIIGSSSNYNFPNTKEVIFTVDDGSDANNPLVIQWLKDNNATFTKTITSGGSGN